MVSFVLPAFKAQYLEQAIISILNQTYSDLELIVVNDASPEDLKTIVEKFHDSRIRYYENEKNIGGQDLVANWNQCLKYATGEFIILASDDDIYRTTFAETLLNLANKYPHIDVFHCRVCVIDESSKPIYLGPSIAEYETDIDFIYQRSVNRRTQLIPDFMIRRQALDKIGGYTNYPKAWYSDEMTMSILSANKGVVCSQEVLFHWRSSKSNISSACNDAPQKAEAAVKFLKDITTLVGRLTPTNEYDKFLKSQFHTQCRRAVIQQIIYDSAKAPLSDIKKVLRIAKSFGAHLSNRDKLRLYISFLRNRLKI